MLLRHHHAVSSPRGRRFDLIDIAAGRPAVVSGTFRTSATSAKARAGWFRLTCRLCRDMAFR